MSEEVFAHCSWPQVAGNELSKLVPTRLAVDDIFEKPQLDDVVNEERAVLFASNKDPLEPCELQFKISPRFKIAALTMVCSASKVELFLGAAQEYWETVYGVTIEDDNGDNPIMPYRFDVEIDRSGIAEINIKLLTPLNEICIYGVMLHIAPNPNGITTLLPKPIDQIQDLLNQSGAGDDVHKLNQLMALMKAQNANIQADAAQPQMDLMKLQAYIDGKFEQLERTIAERLEAFEAQQAQKLDKIISMLNKGQD